MNDIAIEVEEDPVPIVRIIAAQFRHSLKFPEFVRLAGNFNGTFALASTVDPQAVTVTGHQGTLSLKRGVSKDAAIVIRLDFNKPDDSPKVEGLLRHPLLALNVGKLMETFETNWTRAGEDFWSRTRHIPGMPTAIELRCTDDGRRLTLGDDVPELVLEGTSKQLIEILTGGNVLVAAVVEGKIRVHGSMKHLVILSGATKDLMLGEL